jgi:HEAT repeat protein
MKHMQNQNSRRGPGGAARTLSGAAALGSLGKRMSSFDALKVIQLLRSGDPQLRENAINTLSRYGGRDTIIHIARCLHDANIKVRIEACRALGEMRAHNVKAKLYDAVHDKNPLVVCAAASALVRMGDKHGLPAVAKLVFIEGQHRCEAIRTLNKITGHDFRANESGVKEARKWIRRKKDEIFK